MEELKKQDIAVINPRQEFFKSLAKPDMSDLVSSATDSTGECPEDFKCNICHRLVYEPQECVACNQIYCNTCIQGWHKKEKSCPLCKVEGDKFNPIGKLVKSILDKTKLKGCPVDNCEKNAKAISYQTLNYHLLTECSAICVLCPLGCQSSFPRVNWEEHYDQNCPNVQISCEKCEQLMQRQQRGEHSCVEFLKQKNQVLEAQLKEALNQVDALAKQMAQQRDLHIEEMKQASYAHLERFQCPYDGEVFDHKQMIEHICNKHQGKNNVCPICKVRGGDPNYISANLAGHMMYRHVDNPLYKPKYSKKK